MSEKRWSFAIMSEKRWSFAIMSENRRSYLTGHSDRNFSTERVEIKRPIWKQLDYIFIPFLENFILEKCAFRLF